MSSVRARTPAVTRHSDFMAAAPPAGTRPPPAPPPQPSPGPGAGHKGRAAASPRLLTGREEPPGLPGPPDAGFGPSRAGGARLGAGGEGSGRAPARRRLCGVGSAPLAAAGREGGKESRKGLVCSCWQEFPVSAREGPASGRAAGVFQRFSGKQAGKQLPPLPRKMVRGEVVGNGNCLWSKWGFTGISFYPNSILIS